MARKQLPPVAVVISFIDCINRGDADGLGSLMTGDHELVVFDESPCAAKRGTSTHGKAMHRHSPTT
jgi:hypothetical protein